MPVAPSMDDYDILGEMAQFQRGGGGGGVFG
jgi:hypothetical protein